MRTLYAIQGGFAGAAAVTILHETLKITLREAPRMDLLGRQALVKGLRAAGIPKPGEGKLYAITLVGDLISNALYYSTAGIGKRNNVLLRGAALGLAAGIGAILLPQPMGLNPRHSSRRLETGLLTMGLYITGGLVAAGLMKFLDRHKKKRTKAWEDRLVTSSMA
jgi:hypothetical protein